eukprot:1782654-Heterocapsa_arctica.AAC.1
MVSEHSLRAKQTTLSSPSVWRGQACQEPTHNATSSSIATAQLALRQRPGAFPCPAADPSAMALNLA